MPMQLRPDQLEFPFSGGRVCLDLVGTVGQRGREGGYERLREPSDVGRWIVAAGLADRAPRVSDEALAMTHGLRESIHRCVIASRQMTSPQPVDVDVINGAAAWPTRVPQLNVETLEVFWTSARPLRSALATVARDAVDLMATGLITRVRECSASDCTLLFLDESRGGRRRWCSMERCGNRAKTANYRRSHAGRHASTELRGGPS